MYVTLPLEPAAQDTAPVSAAAPRTRRHAAGSHLFREGDEAVHLYEVVSGVLRLTRVLENGRRQVIAFGLPGDIVGFPNGSEHHTDCDVLADAEIVAHRRRCLETGAGDPETHQRLLNAALREISAMQDHVMLLARKSAMERVASFLTVLCRRTGRPVGRGSAFTLPMSRADIADFLGLTIETVSRAFSQMRKGGTIALDTPQDVLVRDMDALLELAEAAD